MNSLYIIHTYIHTYNYCTYIHTQYITIHTYIHTYIHTHTYIHNVTHTHKCTYLSIHTYMYITIHTYIRTYMHIILCILPCMCVWNRLSIIKFCDVIIVSHKQTESCRPHKHWCAVYVCVSYSMYVCMYVCVILCLIWHRKQTHGPAFLTTNIHTNIPSLHRHVS